MRLSPRPGQVLTIVGAAVAVAGGFAPWYLAQATYGGQTFDLIRVNGFQQPNPGLSVLAIGLCVTAGAVALAELLVPNARRSGSGDAAPTQGLGFAPNTGGFLAPISLGITAFALVIAKYLWQETYASMGFLVTGLGAVLVTLGGILVFWAGLLARRLDPASIDSAAEETSALPAPS